MLTLAIGGLCGAGIGRVRGGSFRRLQELRFRSHRLLILALVVQAAFGLFPPGARRIAFAAAYGLVAAWLVVNARGQQKPVRRALALVTLGWLLNLLPIMLNGGMPVSRHALGNVGADPVISVNDGHFFKHVAAGRHTAFAALGDVIPVRELRCVISAGDIVIVAGVMLLVAFAMQGRSSISELRDGGSDTSRHQQ